MTTEGRLTRRALLRGGALLLAGTGPVARTLAALAEESPAEKRELRFGLCADIHYADKRTRGSRHYRASLGRMEECVAAFNEGKAELAVELGDFIDSADTLKREIGHLKAIEKVYAGFDGDRHYVLGNHCVHGLTKGEFLEHSGAERSYYSFDHGRFHFVVLDACFRHDGKPYGRRNFDWKDANIPEPQLKWLRKDLAGTDKKTLVFVHQRLDVAGAYGVRNAPAVRRVLEGAGNVAAVFQGHNHKNVHNVIGGIHYCTLAAVVDGGGPKSNAYALVDVFADDSLRIDGFEQQKDYDLPL